ncbi:MAG: O-antigen ligase domain-containing protein, partial [Phocaeicola sp.]|nr:O-antigen ligase domain-containing protein [Phocaeicola sp.]
TVLLVLSMIAGSRKHLAGMGGCLVSLMVFACFSYPLHIPAIVSVWLLAVIVLSGEGLVMIKRKRYAVAVLLPVVVAGLTVSVNMYGMYSARTRAVRKWMPVRVLYHSGAFKAAAEEYGKLYDKMFWNKDFCFEYGRALYKAGSCGEAEEVLLEAMTVSGDPMILNILGRNAQESGEYGKAEMYLLRSTRRLPERVYPHYLLVKLYAESEYFDRVKLIREAEYVLNVEPKVNSTAIREMRQEVKNILEDKELLENK